MTRKKKSTIKQEQESRKELVQEEVEKVTQQAEALSLTSLSSSSPFFSLFPTSPFVKRPVAPGQLGSQISIFANHIKLTKLSSLEVFHYHVVFDPEPKAKKASLRLWQVFQEQEKKTKANPVPIVFDGFKNAFCAIPYPKANQKNFLEFDSKKDESKTKKKEVPLTQKRSILLKQVGKINMHELQLFIQGKVSLNGNILMAIQVMDVILRYHPLMTLKSLGRSFFPMDNVVSSFRGGIDLIGGLFQSIRPSKSMVTLNLDLAFTTFYRPMPYMDFVCELLQRSRSEIGSLTSWNPSQIQFVEKQSRGLRIRVLHRKEVKTKTYRISGLTQTSCENTFFQLSSSSSSSSSSATSSTTTMKKISVAQYFYNRYNIHLAYVKAPCLIVQSTTLTNAMYLPMEVCELIPSQKYLGKLTEQQTSMMIRETALRPQVRFAKIKELATKILNLSSSSSLFSSFGFQLESPPSFLQLKARLLPPPQLELGQGKTLIAQSGEWHLPSNSFHSGVQLNSLGIINLTSMTSFYSPPRLKLSDTQVLNALQKGLFPILEKKGLQLNFKKKSSASMCPIFSITHPSSLRSSFLRIYQDITQYYHCPPEILILIFPKKSSEMYAECKQLADTLLGVPTQILLVENVLKNHDMYWSNVALKINVKTSSQSSSSTMTSFSSSSSSSLRTMTRSSISSSSLNVMWPNNAILGNMSIPKYFSKKFMILGADVTHPAPGHFNEPSIAGLVGSMDLNGTYYSSQTWTLPSRQEELMDFNVHFSVLLKKFNSYHHCWPEYLLFYRDGVSEGQFDIVYKKEIPFIYQTYQELSIPFKPKLTYVVVQKRHHTRFLGLNPKDLDYKSGNLPSGLLVDDPHLIHPTDFDFYLQSQKGLMGTSRPTHYSVLMDEYPFSQPDELYLLTYYLCFLYARASKAVKLVAPVYYAHLLCFRARYRIRHSFEETKQERGKIKGTKKEEEGEKEIVKLEPLHSNLNDVMYYL